MVVAADADFTLDDGSLTVTTGSYSSTMSLVSIELAVLTGGPSGNDFDVAGFSGNTILTGGEGDDMFTAGSGSDFVFGGLGTDTYIRDLSSLAVSVQAALQNSALHLVLDPSGTPHSEIDPLDSIETVSFIGTPNNDTIDVSGWSAGSLSVDGGGGSDILQSGVDGTVTLTDSLLTFTGGIGSIGISQIEAAILVGGDGDDLLNASAFSGAVWLQGGKGNDVLIASQGTLIASNSILQGDEGDDLFVFVEDGMMNRARIIGGDGNDTLTFGGYTDMTLAIPAWSAAVAVDLSLTGVDQNVVPGDLVLRLNAEDIEILLGGDGADNLTGNSLDNTLTGGAGADTIDGGGGTNRIVETADADFVLTDASLTIGSEMDTLVNIQQATLTGGASDNTIDASGFTGTTILSGEAGNDKLTGGSDDDVLIGGADNDTLIGGAGNDWYQFDVDEVLGEDTIDEMPGVAGGNDVIDFSPTQTQSVKIDLSVTAQQTVHATNLKLTLTHGDSVENAIGGDQDDILTGNSLDNAFIGGLGNDTFDGGTSLNTVLAQRDANFVATDTTLMINGETDTLVGGTITQLYLVGGDGNNTLDASAFTLGRVILNGGAGNDILIGGAGQDYLGGGDGNDQLYGNDNNDTLEGGAGNDMLNGGAGDDTLRGNAGNDTYVFDQSFNQGSDMVTELAGEGYADTLLGVGLSGVVVDLHMTTPQVISANLTLTLTVVGTVEFSF